MASTNQAINIAEFDKCLSELNRQVYNQQGREESLLSDSESKLWEATKEVQLAKEGKSEKSLAKAKKEEAEAQERVNRAKESLQRVKNLNYALSGVEQFSKSSINLDRESVQKCLTELSMSMEEKDFNKLLASVNEPISNLRSERTDLFRAGEKKTNVRNDIEAKMLSAKMENLDMNFKFEHNGGYNEFSGSFSKILDVALGDGRKVIEDNFADFKVKKAEDTNFELSDAAKSALKILKERANIAKKDEKGMTLKSSQINVAKIENTIRQKEMLDKSIVLLTHLKNDLEQAQQNTNLTTFKNEKGKTVTSQLDYSKLTADLSKTIIGLRKDLEKASKTLEGLGLPVVIKEDGSINYGGIVQNARIDIDTYNMYKGKEIKVLGPKTEEEQISPEAYTMYDRYQQTGTGLEFPQWCAENDIPLPQGWERVQEERFEGMKEYQKQQIEAAEAQSDEIDPKAYTTYDYYQKSGTGLPFEKWCEEKGVEVPKGWEKVQAEHFKGMSEYQKQQVEAAEAQSDVIDPKAYTTYDYYQKSGTGLPFEKWCEEKGVEVPKGWEKVQAERFAGMSEYQKQQVEDKEQDYDGMDM